MAVLTRQRLVRRAAGSARAAAARAAALAASTRAVGDANDAPGGPARHASPTAQGDDPPADPQNAR